MGNHQNKSSSMSFLEKRKKSSACPDNVIDEPLPKEVSPGRHSSTGTLCQSDVDEHRTTEQRTKPFKISAIGELSSDDSVIEKTAVKAAASEPESSLEPSRGCSSKEITLLSDVTDGTDGVTSRTGISQDSPRRISRKKKQGQTRLKKRHGKSNRAHCLDTIQLGVTLGRCSCQYNEVNV